MGIKTGAYLGGIRTIEDLRLRCVCTPLDDCWRLRTARGRPMPKDMRHSINVHGVGGMTATRAAWMLAGKKLRNGMAIFRVCESYDCVNPKHLKQGSRGDVARHNATQGRFGSKEQLAPLAASRARRTKATSAHIRLIVESGLPSRDLASQVPLSRGRINAIRRERAGMPANSVFSWGGVA